MSETSPVHVVLIGAARSGTKIMRDALATATGSGRVPYDIGYVWRVADPGHADDVLDPDLLTARGRAFITRFLDRYASGAPVCVIEKTVGNTLRVPYVAKALPDARFVHLIRNGVDVTESTWRQWREPSDYRYLAGKLRHFPLRMVPTYGRRYATSLLRRRTTADGRVGTWGPRYAGIDDDLRTADLLTVCARQWRESVTAASRDLVELASLEVRYEDLVADPARELSRVAEFCGLSASSGTMGAASEMVRPGREGTGSRSLDAFQLTTLDREIGDLLERLGYPRPRRPEQEVAGDA